MAEYSGDRVGLRPERDRRHELNLVRGHRKHDRVPRERRLQHRRGLRHAASPRLVRLHGGTCVLSCNSGYYSCASVCIADGSCCTNANCTATQPQCPPDPGGTTCSGTTGASSTCQNSTCKVSETVTITLNYPSLAAIKTIEGSFYTPTTTYTGTVTFTNNSKSVTGGTTFTTQFAAGQSISSDGVNYYPIASVSNATITLVSAYPQPTTTVGTYYEADCVAGQVCPSAQSFSIAPASSCTTTASVGTGTAKLCTVTTTVTSATGAYAISATATDANGQAQAASVNPNKLLLTGSGDLDDPVVNLVQAFPIGNGGNATCPLNLAADWSGNIWSVNGNGSGDSTCAAPTNNISKLTPASAGSNVYTPTVINNAQITASPEFIAVTDSKFGAGDTSGDIWVTVPSLTNGIFRLSPTGATRSGFPLGGCLTPRGIDDDPTQSPNGAFVACYGTNAAPPANGGRQILQLTSAGAVNQSIYFTDSAAQPVAVTFPRAYTENSTTVYDTDYRCSSDVFVNRSSPTAAVISLLNGPYGTTQALQSSSLYTYTQSATVDTTPFGLFYDGGGTIWSAARVNGNILNLENGDRQQQRLDDQHRLRRRLDRRRAVAVRRDRRRQLQRGLRKLQRRRERLGRERVRRQQHDQHRDPDRQRLRGQDRPLLRRLHDEPGPARHRLRSHDALRVGRQLRRGHLEPHLSRALRLHGRRGLRHGREPRRGLELRRHWQPGDVAHDHRQRLRPRRREQHRPRLRVHRQRHGGEHERRRQPAEHAHRHRPQRDLGDHGPGRRVEPERKRRQPMHLHDTLTTSRLRGCGVERASGGSEA